MECHECGTPILARASFCHACGTPARKRTKRPRGSRRDSRRQRDDRPSDRWETARRKIKKPFNDQETHLWSGTFSYKGMSNEFLIALIATIIIPVVVLMAGVQHALVNWMLVAIGLSWAVLLGNLVIRKLDVHYELTSQRLIHKYGILRRTVNRIEVIDIDDVLFEQGIVERILGSGTIEIISSDKTDPTIELQGIDDVFEVAELIDEARRVERIRRGIHIEAV